MNLYESVNKNLTEDKLRKLAEDFYKYTTDISITEDEWFSNLEADHPELKDIGYNEIVEYAINEILDDLKNNPEEIQRQMGIDCCEYGPDSPEYKEIIEMYNELKDAGININLDRYLNESEEKSSTGYDKIVEAENSKISKSIEKEAKNFVKSIRPYFSEDEIKQLPEFRAYVDAIKDPENIWCQCPEEHESTYKPDSPYLGVNKHGWICKKCKKYTQIG